jgi:4-amino-4-deoxy-L-arabinose transferase-like glycosyltransferase
MDNQPSSGGLTKSSLALLVVVLIGGIFVRAWPSTGCHRTGFDEGIYSTYVEVAQKDGIWHYENVVRAYVQSQAKHAEAFVPATRVGFLWPASVLAATCHLQPLAALHYISFISSILLLFVVPIIGYRLKARGAHLLLLTTLMAVAPLQIHLAQRSLIDGYFAFWAILCAWFLWESLQKPEQKAWSVAYGVSLFILVLTKENAAFVSFALVTVLIIFAIFRFGRASLALVLMTVLAPALAIVVLAGLVGGIREWIAFYSVFVQKSRFLPYPVRFQDGAWYRYFVDFTLLSPLVVALAIGRIFQLERKEAADIFWSLFLGVSFVAMSSVPYGMSLRFAAYWDVPLRWLAASQVVQLTKKFSRISPVISNAVILLILVAVDLFQYWRYFMHAGIYDPVSFELLRASRLLK